MSEDAFTAWRANHGERFPRSQARPVTAGPEVTARTTPDLSSPAWPRLQERDGQDRRPRFEAGESVGAFLHC